MWNLDRIQIHYEKELEIAKRVKDSLEFGHNNRPFWNKLHLKLEILRVACNHLSVLVEEASTSVSPLSVFDEEMYSYLFSLRDLKSPDNVEFENMPN
jgi:hypothetical protein